MPRSSGCEVQRSVINFEILRLNIGDRGHYSTQNGDRNRRNSYPQYGKQSYGDRPQSGQHKRKRDDETGPRDDASRLLASIFRLGDAKPGQEASIKEDIDDQYRLLRRDVQHGRAEMVRETILECTLELSTKTSMYATLVGLLNADDSTFVTKLLEQATQRFSEALAAADKNSPRLLLRFFAALVPANVLHPSSVLNALCSIVDAALEAAEAGGTEDEGRRWQPYTDFLVYSALMALPWGASDLAQSAPADLDRLFARVEEYICARPRSRQDALKPFLAEEGEGGTPAQSDSGGASFLGQVWEAIQELRAEAGWKVESIMHFATAFEAQLATGQPHDLPALQAPKQPPIDPSLSAPEAAAAVLEAFPPRGITRLLPAEHTSHGKPQIERLVAEEYILDTIIFFEGDRVQCAQHLARLPLPNKHEALLAEMLFSQMLCVPQPRLKPLAYSTLMVDVCKLMPTFPRGMSACVREAFLRMGAMDPLLRTRLSQWLAYHLSNYDFMWPWDKWKHVLTAPLHDAQRRFVVETLSNLIRLSYWSRIKSVVPASFHELLPPAPEVQPIPGPPEAQAAQDKAEAMPNAAADERDPATKRACEMLNMVKHKVMSEGVLAWIGEQGLDEELGGPKGVLSMVLRVLLVAGAKSFTHMITALERYCLVLQTLLAQTGAEGEVAMVAVAAEVWKAAPQKAAQAIDRLMALRLVSGTAIVNWVFGSHGVSQLDDELATGLAWEVFYNAVNKTLARAQDAEEDVGSAQQHLLAVEAHAQEAASMVAQMGAQDAMSAEFAEGVTQNEAAAMAAVSEAQQQVEQSQQDQLEAIQQQQDVLLLAFTRFRDLLLEAEKASDDLNAGAPGEMNGTADNAAGHEESGAREAWTQFTILSLVAFARHFFKAIASIAEQVETDVFGEALPLKKATRKAVIDCLHI